MQNRTGSAELSNMIQMIVSPAMPPAAKVGILHAINVLLVNHKSHTIYLARDDFCLELGSMLTSSIGSDDGSLAVIISILEKMTGLPPKEREILNRCCNGPLKRLTAHISVVSKANDVLARLHI